MKDVDVVALTAAEILAIPVGYPEKLFMGVLDTAKGQYRRLATKWHPDKNSQTDAGKVFAHIQVLYAAAEKRILDGTWRVNGTFVVRDIKSRSEYIFKYKRSSPFELGHMYYGRNTVAWSIDLQYEDLVRNALSVLQRDIRYADTTMRKEHERYLPEVISVVHAADRFVVVMRKKPEFFLLRDVLNRFGVMEARHVAWIVSSLLNLNCYLSWTGVVHCAISPDTWFISPSGHTGALLGGWWYSVRQGQRLKVLPRRTLLYGPLGLERDKVAKRRIDSALIRATARELLGDVSGSRLLSVKDSLVPKAMKRWLLDASESNAYSEYHHWYHDVLKDSFGPRRFVRMEVKPSDIYEEF